MLRGIKRELQSYVEKEKRSPFKPKNFIIESKVYVDEERFELEKKKLQDGTLGPMEEIRESKKYLVDETNGKLYFNSCPHRGARLNPSGSEFICSYHGWVFDKDGSLVKSTGHSCPYPKDSLKLKEIESFQIGGMVMKGKPDPYAEEIQSYLKDAQYLEKRFNSVNCNWKLLVESLLETYHFPFAHVPYLEGFDNAFFSLGTNKGENARIAVPLEQFEEYMSQESFEGINLMYFFFPYTFVLFMNSGFVWFHIVPIKVNESRMECYLYSYDKDDESAKNSLNLLDKILDQDFTILAGQQENAVYSQRFHLTGYEKLIQNFHGNLNEVIKDIL